LSGSHISLPEGRRGQFVALGLLLAAIGLFWGAVAAPLLGWYDARAERLAERRVMLAHMTQVAASLPSLKRAVGATGAGGPPPTALLDGNSDAIAGAALQGMVQDMAKAAGATLASAETLPGEQQGGFRRIGLRVTLSGAWPVLVAMLQAVEGSQVRLLVDDLQLHVTAGGRPGGPKDAPALMQASFVVLGYRPGREAGVSNGDTRPDLRADAGTQGR
jgi:general secretion pathway protein M